MGRLVRVGPYYFPLPTAVGCSLQKVRWTILLIAHDPIAGEVATLYPFRICYRKYPGRSRRLMTPSMLCISNTRYNYL